MIAPCLYIAGSGNKGRGVFTADSIEKGSIVEIAPVLVMDARERELLDQTALYNYIFEWGEEGCLCCLAFGWLSLYNHSYESNCEYDMDYATDTISVKTVRFIKAGEELFINYNGTWNDKKQLWFDAQ